MTARESRAVAELAAPECFAVATFRSFRTLWSTTQTFATAQMNGTLDLKGRPHASSRSTGIDGVLIFLELRGRWHGADAFKGLLGNGCPRASTRRGAEWRAGTVGRLHARRRR